VAQGQGKLGYKPSIEGAKKAMFSKESLKL